jgi:SAM-dependent methyltransferase
VSNMLGRYLSAVWSVRRENLGHFRLEHDRLYAEARGKNDHAEVTAWYYSVMEQLIERAYGSSWHFCPPDFPGQSRDDAIHSLHRRMAGMIHLAPGRVALDVGCGVGGAMRDVAAYTGGRVVGISIGPNEVDRNNAISRERGVEHLCNAVCGDAQEMPFEPETFDCGYAIYSLKYFADATRVLRQVHRVLKPGGLFASYNIVRTRAYDPADERQRRPVEFFEYACGMPPLLTEDELVAAGERSGLECVTSMDISRESSRWDHYFLADPLLPTLVRSRAIRRVVAGIEAVGLLPAGFARFNDVFMSGTVESMLEAGRRGALSGSNVTVFRKPLGSA